MKILMLTHTYYPSIGGGIRYKKSIVDHLRKQGHQVDVLCLRSGNEKAVERQYRGCIYRASKNINTLASPISFSYVYLYKKLSANYEVLLFNYPSPMEEVSERLFRKDSTGVKKVVMYHADIVDNKRFSGIYNRFVTTSFLKSMDAIIVSSPTMRNGSRFIEPHKRKVHVIPFGIDLDEYGKAENNPIVTEPEYVNILFVGRMARYKGIDVLLRSFADVRGGRLRLVGEGPLKEEMISLCHKLGIDKRVEFLGGISDQAMIKEYHRSHIFVLPSTDAGEAFGYVLIEAMAGRNAVISTELGTGTSWVNQNNETGLVIEPNSVLALTNAIQILIDDYTCRNTMAEAAYQRSLAIFDIRRMLIENEKVITT